MAYLVVRIKGTVNIPQQAKKTLDGLNLEKRFRATIVPESGEYLGMLRRVKDEVAWTKTDASMVKELLESVAERQATNQSQNLISQMVTIALMTLQPQ